MWVVKTKLPRLQIRPLGPVAKPALAEILVYDPSHPVLVDRRFQCHPVYITRSKSLQVTSYFSGGIILNAGTRFERVVLRDQDLIPLHFASVHLKDAVSKHIRIVIKIVGRKGPRNLHQSRADFGRTERGNFVIDRRRCFRTTGRN
jgi:hypothetical protein